jgi:hypothetical protein
MNTFKKAAFALAAMGAIGTNSANAEIIRELENSNWRFAFTGTGNISYEYRPEFTTLNGGTNAGYERLRFNATLRAQAAYGNIGDPFWSEINVTGRINKVDPMDGAASRLDIYAGNTNNASFGGVNAAFGMGNYYGFASNGATAMYGPGAGHTGAFPRSARGTGFFDTFQRIHGNTGGRDDDVLLAADPSGTLNFISSDLGGTNDETFLGFGYVSDQQHYAIQSSANGEWVALNFAQSITPEIGINAVLYKVDSTNRNGRAVDDHGYDLVVSHVTDKVEYGFGLTGWGLGSSPTWNAENRTRLRLSSSYAVTDRHAVGFNFEYEDFPVINATTGAPVREQIVRRLTVMYGYQLSEYSFLTAQGIRSETDVKSGSLAGSDQDINQIKLSYNFIF